MENKDILSMVKEAIDAHIVYARQFGVELILMNKPASGVVIVDENRFMQVMANLLSNSVKFSPQNDVVHVNVNKHAGYIRVSIHDNGKGIPEEFRPYVFEKFTQADSSDRREHAGNGLGLAIAKKMVETMRGNIGYMSEAGKGTTFYFDLPAI